MHTNSLGERALERGDASYHAPKPPPVAGGGDDDDGNNRRSRPNQPLPEDAVLREKQARLQ